MKEDFLSLENVLIGGIIGFVMFSIGFWCFHITGQVLLSFVFSIGCICFAIASGVGIVIMLLNAVKIYEE